MQEYLYNVKGKKELYETISDEQDFKKLLDF